MVLYGTNVMYLTPQNNFQKRCPQKISGYSPDINQSSFIEENQLSSISCIVFLVSSLYIFVVVVVVVVVGIGVILITY